MLTQWLLTSDEPWTRYRTLVDLLDRPENDPEVQTARAEMLAQPQVQAMKTETATWGGGPFKRHNDASYPIYRFSTLADFGVKVDDPGIASGIEAVLAHQSPEGAFQTLVNIPQRFGGTGEDTWTWILCDTPKLVDSPATHTGSEMLLRHWEHQGERKLFMFGIGTDFRKLKYPFVWYNVLHVVDVLSRFSFVHTDARFQEMVKVITDQADETDRK